MPKTEQADDNSARSRAGDELLERAKAAGAAPLRKPLARFEALHTKYKTLARAASVAEAAVLEAQAAAGAADDAQDDALDALATALVIAGRPRNAPLRGLSKLAPTRIAELGLTNEADEIIAVANKCLATKEAGLKEPSRKALSAAKNAQRAGAASAKAAAAWTKAIQARREIEPAWEKARASVYRTARFLDAEGETTGLHDALVSGTRPRKKTAKAAPAPSPEPAASK